MDPETIWHAIIDQESGGNGPNPGQIQPDTFRQYAQPGENINNPVDNVAVSKRIINDYYNRYNGDVGRIAAAYFSGPGNVSASGPQPFIKNANDGTKTTASYVSDIQRRVSKMAQPDNSGFDADAAFSKFESSPAKATGFDPVSAFSQWEQPVQTVQTASQNGSRVPVPGEQSNVIGTAQNAPGLMDWISQNYHPLSAITQTVGAGATQFGQGVKEVQSGSPASGVGDIFMGGVNSVLGPILGPLNETFRTGGQAIGNPQAADVASLVLPTRGVGVVAKSALPAVRAQSGLINLIGKENIPNVLRRLEANPNLSLMDVSEPVKTVAAGLANSPETPSAQNVMRGAYEARTAARQDIVQQSIDRTLGPPINVKEYLDQLKTNVRKVGQERISPAIEGAQPIGVMPLADRLDSIIKAPGTADETISRLTKLKNQLTAEAGSDGFIDPQKLHGIQWRLRAEAENLAKSSSGADRNLSGPLFNARNDMVDALDVASGGKYKPALAGFRDENNVQDAFEKGFNIFSNKGVEDFPEYWDAWIKQAQPAEIAAAKVGALTAARKTIEGMQGGARRGENILNPTFAQNKFAALFGPQQTSQLSGLLADARDVTDTNSLLYRNSKTAQVTAGQNFLAPRQVGAPAGAATGVGVGLLGSLLMAGGSVEPGLLGMGIGGLKAAHTGMQYIGRLADKSTATKFAKLASATGPERNELINLLRSADSSASGNKVSNLIPSLVRLAAP